MGRSLPYIIIGLLVYMILFYLENYQPELVTNVLLEVDVVGFTKVAAQENDRLSKIKVLMDPDDPNQPLSYDKKQVLINRTVFMGATTEMVKLALGKPQSEIKDRDNVTKTIVAVNFVYYLGNDKRPTVLVFQNDKLVNAYVGSAIDPNLNDGLRNDVLKN